MTIIEHDLLPKQRARKNNLKVKVVLYAYASELYDDLASHGYIQRLKEIPQLGLIKVPKKLMKSRFDYTVLQLYFHQLVKKGLQAKLQLTYNNLVKAGEFHDGFCYCSPDDKPTIADMLQILTIAYNLGHFFNTFTASRAVIMLAEEDLEFQKILLDSSTDARFHETAKKFIAEKNYRRLHLLNSLLVLERCDQSKQSVILARELLYAYLNQDTLSIESKLHFVFNIFRDVRNVSYIAYDLQIANTPFAIDLCNDKAILVLFNELLSEYNDQLSAKQLITSVSKLLDDTVYNENSNAICYYQISKKIAATIRKDTDLITNNYFSDFWNCTESQFNIKQREKRDYSPNSILKLTFTAEDRYFSQELLLALDRINNSRVGYYDRSFGKHTILVSIKKRSVGRTLTAYRILKTTIGYLRRLQSNKLDDCRYLLVSKFFLYYFFDENPLVIRGTIDPDVCVVCTRGKKQRIQAINSLLSNEKGTIDERHEAELINQVLLQDRTNDTSIVIPASIIVYDKFASGKKLCELDGIVIHLFRKDNQLLLFEAKNINEKPLYARRCLVEKLNKLNITYDSTSIETINYDAVIRITINQQNKLNWLR